MVVLPWSTWAIMAIFLSSRIIVFDSELVVDDMDFSSVITSVQGGKSDIAMAGLTVTEERKEMVVTYLKGLVAYAEKKLGSGKGTEKLKLVEDMFKKKAPMIYKMLLKATGVKDIKELIEVALAEVKRDFVK